MAAVGTPGSEVTDCVTKVALSISCENLLDMDTFSKSDPQCVLLMNSSGPHWCEVNRFKSCSSAFACSVNKWKFNKKVLDSETCICVRLAGQRKSRTALIPSFPRLLSLTTTLRWCRSWGFKCTTLTLTTAVCKSLTSWENRNAPWDRWAHLSSQMLIHHAFFSSLGLSVKNILFLCPDCVLKETNKTTCPEEQVTCRERNHYCELLSFRLAMAFGALKVFSVYMCSLVYNALIWYF